MKHWIHNFQIWLQPDLARYINSNLDMAGWGVQLTHLLN